MTTANSILVIQTAFIGDVILLTPLLAAVKRQYPDHRLDVLVIPACVNILQNNPHVDQIWSYDKRGRQKGWYGFYQLARQLKSAHYDMIFCPHRSARSALLTRCTRAPVRIGFDKNSWSWCFTHLVHYESSWHEIDRNLKLLSAHGTAVTLERPSLYPDQQDILAVEKLTAAADKKRPWAVLAPGSVWPTKRWPENHFHRLAQLLINNGWTVFLLGGREDQLLCKRIAAGCDARLIDASGRLTLRASAELLRHCRWLVANDSAPLHLASAMNTPTIALFGPTVPAFGFGPVAEGSLIVEENLVCRPCSSHGGMRCPIKTHACLQRITAEIIFRHMTDSANRK
jgi:heptosyltransferase II